MNPKLNSIFKDHPVTAFDKHRIILEEVVKESPQNVFSEMMSLINPFAKYVIEDPAQKKSEEKEEEEEEEKKASIDWEMEESIFQNAPEGVNLHKSTTEMFVIYKYCPDPEIRVKSEQTDNKFL